MGFLVELAAGLLCVGAGGYLLLQHGTPIDLGGGQEGESWLEVIAHGMGVYFIGKGLFVWRSTYLQSAANDRLDAIAEWLAYSAGNPEEDNPRK